MLAIGSSAVLLLAATTVLCLEHLDSKKRSDAWIEAKTQEGSAEAARLQWYRFFAGIPGRPGMIPIPVFLSLPF
jgi:hypothetical protein